MPEINSIMDKVFDIIKAGKMLVWEVIKFPFIYWFGMPEWVRWTAFVILILLGIGSIYFLYRLRNRWREVYTI